MILSWALFLKSLPICGPKKKNSERDVFKMPLEPPNFPIFSKGQKHHAWLNMWPAYVALMWTIFPESEWLKRQFCIIPDVAVSQPSL